jgi:hypothetical protein
VIVCYAHGEGLGHLTRLRAYLHTIGHHAPVTILTASAFAADPRVTGPHPIRRIPPDLALQVAPPRTRPHPPAGAPPRTEAPPRTGGPSRTGAPPPTEAAGRAGVRDRAGLRDWVGGVLREMGAAEFVVDAFPAGLLGELDDSVVPEGTSVTHLARLLRWAEYEEYVPERPLRFDRTFVVEPVGHLPYLEEVSGSVAPIELIEPPAPGAEGPGGWLVVHTGPDEEIHELVAYARDMAGLEGVRSTITLVAPRRPTGLAADVRHLDVYPAWPLFAGAERIVTAAGCNAVRQLAPWRDRHRMLPFPRRFDDQYARASRTRSGR